MLTINNRYMYPLPVKISTPDLGSENNGNRVLATVAQTLVTLESVVLSDEMTALLPNRLRRLGPDSQPNVYDLTHMIFFVLPKFNRA
jgi:hypothetical protein